MPLHLQEDFCGTALLRWIMVIVAVSFTCFLEFLEISLAS